jgi:hypothetical protein
MTSCLFLEVQVVGSAHLTRGRNRFLFNRSFRYWWGNQDHHRF